MNSAALLRLIILVACAHGLVHIYEQSLPSIEQNIAAEFYGDDVSAGKAMTGMMSNSWRFTWGMGALVAGWLVDRFGGRRMLAIYLFGCSAMCGVLVICQSPAALFAVMLLMGAFASIYHPAGLALLSHHTRPDNRPRALGLHGVLGSVGIGAAPLIAWLTLKLGGNWRSYYVVLAIPGILLGCYFAWTSYRDGEGQQQRAETPVAIEDAQARWGSFFLLALVSALQGFIYSAILSFLPRFLSTGDDGSLLFSLLQRCGLVDAQHHIDGRFLASLVLWCGCLGQYLAGRLAQPRILERQMAFVFLGIVPFLLWMAIAEGTNRIIAAALFATIHFMHQPIYSSLIAKYSPPHRRSLCYGFSFAMGLGVGSFGASFNGFSPSDTVTYSTLAGIAIAAGTLTILLASLNATPPATEAK
ncbi:MAG TPA: hypothetical protein DCY79_21840 [Planctomycetaceae bacterium]|nr:hypothetical protein [Blastopirellula sp.]HAY82457.1 hypothetical protein [Planctomycetaceae bacterium]